jgi:hypothetical protein
VAITITWATRVINVPKADTTLIQASPTEIRELDIDTFRLALKGLEAGGEGMTFPDTHLHYAPVDVGGVTLARVVALINSYTVTFEDGQYAVNLVGANSNIGDNVNVNQVSVRSFNSAGLIQTREIEHASFNGVITVDAVNGSAGTLYPLGTEIAPVNNLDDAALIGAVRGISTLSFIGNFTVGASDDISGFILRGESMEKTILTLTAGCTTANAEFRDCCPTGQLNGGTSTINYCCLYELYGLNGEVTNSILKGDVQIDGDSGFFNCFSGVAGAGTPVIDANGQDLQVRGYSGGLELRNIDQPTQKVSVDLVSGRLVLASSVSDGTIVIRGVGLLADNSTGSVSINADGLISTESVARTTWDCVTIDTVNGQAGTVFPIGTARYPVDNLADAVTIAARETIEEFHVHGNITLSGSFDGCLFKSHSPAVSTIDLNNQSVEGAAFEHVGLTGACNGSILAHGSELTSMTNLKGDFFSCGLSGSFSVKSAAKAYFFDAFSHDLSPMTFDLNGNGKLVYYGTAWITVTNLTDAAGMAAFSGDIGVTIANSVTGGYVYITGDTVIDADNSAGGTVVQAYKNTQKVWTEDLTNLSPEGSAANMMKRILGLTQENFYIKDQVYDDDGNMTSAVMRTYTDNVSVGTENNIRAEYNITAAYNAQGECISYRSVKV